MPLFYRRRARAACSLVLPPLAPTALGKPFVVALLLSSIAVVSCHYPCCSPPPCSTPRQDSPPSIGTCAHLPLSSTLTCAALPPIPLSVLKLDETEPPLSSLRKLPVQAPQSSNLQSPCTQPPRELTEPLPPSLGLGSSSISPKFPFP